MSLRTVLAGVFCGIVSGSTGVALGYAAYNPLSESAIACFLFILVILSGALLVASLRRDGRSPRYALLAALVVCGVVLIVAAGVTWGFLTYQSSQLTGA